MTGVKYPKTQAICPGGWRWSSEAGDDLAAVCVAAFAVSVTKTGDGGGTVTSMPAGIDCGTACSSQVADNHVITLHATPDVGTFTEFAGWGGDASSCGTNTTCTVVVDADKNVTAMFNPMPLVSVTVTGGGTGTVASQPSGLSCPGTCSARFPTNTAVKLTATPASASGLLGWSGDAVSCGFDSSARCRRPEPRAPECALKRAGTWLGRSRPRPPAARISRTSVRAPTKISSWRACIPVKAT